MAISDTGSAFTLVPTECRAVPAVVEAMWGEMKAMSEDEYAATVASEWLRRYKMILQGVLFQKCRGFRAYAHKTYSALLVRGLRHLNFSVTVTPGEGKYHAYSKLEVTWALPASS